MIRLSGLFHLKLAELGGNAIPVEILGQLVTRSSLILWLFGSNYAANCPNHEHADMIAATGNEDATEAENLISQHLGHIFGSLDLTRGQGRDRDLLELLREGA